MFVLVISLLMRPDRLKPAPYKSLRFGKHFVSFVGPPQKWLFITLFVRVCKKGIIVVDPIRDRSKQKSDSLYIHK